MSTVQLPGGHTAELREKLTIGGRERLTESSADLFALIRERCPDLETLKEFADLPPGAMDGTLLRMFHRLNRTAVLVYLKSWTRPEQIPSSDAMLDDLDADVYDALSEAVAPLALTQVKPSDYVANPETLQNPDSPTVPSSVSGGGGQDPTTPMTSLPSGSSGSEKSSTSVAVSR